jgi:hypothetical protein
MVKHHSTVVVVHCISTTSTKLTYYCLFYLPVRLRRIEPSFHEVGSCHCAYKGIVILDRLQVRSWGQIVKVGEDGIFSCSKPSLVGILSNLVL